jgi:hypothetical protein
MRQSQIRFPFHKSFKKGIQTYNGMCKKSINLEQNNVANISSEEDYLKWIQQFIQDFNSTTKLTMYNVYQLQQSVFVLLFTSH